MKLQLNLIAGVIVAGGFSLPALAEPAPTPAAYNMKLGADKPLTDFANIEVKNLRDENLGRISDLGIDLVNGRIVEVLVVTDSSLDAGGKLVAVPPLALIPDPINRVYRLDASAEVFKTAAAIDLSKWVDSGRSERIAAAYHLFGQEPYFLQEGETASTTAARPKVSLGYVERSSKILDMPVKNEQDEKFGKVWAMTLNIPRGRIESVVILAPGNFKTKSIVPAMALSFNPARDALLLDDTKTEFADEPRYVLTEAAYGQEAYAREDSYKGPRTSAALDQGFSFRDVDRTVRINKDLRDAKININHLQVGTIDGRVTLRGWVDTAEERSLAGQIAVSDSRLELVDNQITVGKPLTGN